MTEFVVILPTEGACVLPKARKGTEGADCVLPKARKGTEGADCVLPNIDATRNWITEKKYTTNRENRDLYFKGPTQESNWLIRDSFMVGSYPDKPGYMKAILDAGLKTFVCLNSEYGKMVNGNYYEPYGNFIPDENFIHEPIDDMKVADDDKIRVLTNTIAERIRRGEKVYLHCAGGHGRAGTVASLVLHLLYPALTEMEILEYIQYAHDQRDANYFGPKKFILQMFHDDLADFYDFGQVPSPQSSAQRNQIRRLW